MISGFSRSAWLIRRGRRACTKCTRARSSLVCVVRLEKKEKSRTRCAPRGFFVIVIDLIRKLVETVISSAYEFDCTGVSNRTRKISYQTTSTSCVKNGHRSTVCVYWIHAGHSVPTRRHVYLYGPITTGSWDFFFQIFSRRQIGRRQRDSNAPAPFFADVSSRRRAYDAHTRIRVPTTDPCTDLDLDNNRRASRLTD